MGAVTCHCKEEFKEIPKRELGNIIKGFVDRQRYSKMTINILPTDGESEQGTFTVLINYLDEFYSG
jgi:hypothetical protein